MIKIKLDKTYEVPTNWWDVTYINFAQSRNKPFHERLAIYSGIPGEVLATTNLEIIKQIIGIVKFQEELPDFHEQVDVRVEVGDEHYVKFEHSRAHLEQKENEWLACIDIVKEYLQMDISDKPVPKVFGYAVFFCNKFQTSSPVTKH